MIKADVRQQISIYWQLKFIFKQMAPALLSYGVEHLTVTVYTPCTLNTCNPEGKNKTVTEN